MLNLLVILYVSDTQYSLHISLLKLEGHSVERMYLRQRCSDSPVNKTILKPPLAAAAGGQYVYVGFSRRKIPRNSAYMISEKAIRFRHPDYNSDRAQKIISSSMSRHLSTRNSSSKSMHAFFSNLANRQTDRQTNEHGQKHLPPPLSEVTKAYNVIISYRLLFGYDCSILLLSSTTSLQSWGRFLWATR